MNQEYVQTQVVEAAMANWEMILEEVSEMTAEYETSGWEPVVLRPGEVQPVSSETVDPGLDVLIPDDEYRELEETLESGVSFQNYEVHKDVMDGVVHLVVVMEDHTNRTVLLYPAYYGVEDARFLEEATRVGEFRTYLRRLNGEYIELTHADPCLFAPPSN